MRKADSMKLVGKNTPRKKKEDWFTVICLSLYDDIFNRGIDAESKDHRFFGRDELWLSKRLTYKGQVRSKKFLRAWLFIKYIVLGFLFTCFILSSELSEPTKTFWIIADIIVVVCAIYYNRK